MICFSRLGIVYYTHLCTQHPEWCQAHTGLNSKCFLKACSKWTQELQQSADTMFSVLENLWHPMYRHYWWQRSWWTGGGRLWVLSLAGGFWVSQEDFGKWRTEAWEVHSTVIRTQWKAVIYYAYYNVKPPLHCLQALGILAHKSFPSSCWQMFRGAEKPKRRRTGGAEFGTMGEAREGFWFPQIGRDWSQYRTKRSLQLAKWVKQHKEDWEGLQLIKQQEEGAFLSDTAASWSAASYGIPCLEPNVFGLMIYIPFSLPLLFFFLKG